MSKNARAGRPKYQPSQSDRDYVKSAVAQGVSRIEMAKHLGIHRHTLAAIFDTELALSKNTGSRSKRFAPQKPPVIAKPTVRAPHQATTTPAAAVPDPYAAKRGKVESLAGYGILDPEEIASVLDLSVDEVRDHFAKEMLSGPAKVKTKVIETLYKIAIDPEDSRAVSAASTFLRAAGHMPGPHGESKERPQRLGKKESARRAAANAAQNGRFRTPAPPLKLATVNGSPT